MKYFVLIILIFIAACKGGVSEISDSPTSANEATLIADTIIYDVVIKNLNPYDDWAVQCLQKLRHDKFIDSLFSLIYAKKVIAYDYTTNKPIKVRELKNIEREEEFLREAIGKIQFTESWYLDNKSANLQKEVISIVLGHELYTDSGEFIGYKPIFKILMNP